MAQPQLNVEAPPRHESEVSTRPALLVRWLGCVPYCKAVQTMRARTEAGGVDSPDELWLLEHPSVFTLGQAGRRSHVREAGAIPVVRSDRGGQVTYHGPGQLVAYLLFDLRRARIGVRRIVEMLEQATIAMLGGVQVAADRRDDAPGVYVEGRKIASIGLRVRGGRTFHGTSINVDMDLSPFSRIDTCGFPDLPVTRLADLAVGWRVEETGRRFAASLGRMTARKVVWGESGESAVRGFAARVTPHESATGAGRRRDL